MTKPTIFSPLKIFIVCQSAREIESFLFFKKPMSFPQLVFLTWTSIRESSKLDKRWQEEGGVKKCDFYLYVVWCMIPKEPTIDKTKFVVVENKPWILISSGKKRIRNLTRNRCFESWMFLRIMKVLKKVSNEFLFMVSSFFRM